MEHYYIKETNTLSDEKLRHIKINDLSFDFLTDNAVFSKKGLDFGTRTLLESLEELKGSVLDIGCGYGPIGIYIKTKYDTDVTMSDINKRALNLAMKNCCLNKVKCTIIESDMYENITEKYDYIVSNPPIRIGKSLLYEMLFKAKEHLKENGSLIIVVNKNQGAKTLVKDLSQAYQVSVINKNKGFYVILAKTIKN